MNEEKSALLVMDVQPAIVGRLPKPDDYLSRASSVVASARAHGVPVIFVVVGFREGTPEVSAANKSFSARIGQSAGSFLNPEPALAVQPGDIVVTKRRVSAFTGSDLEVVLRAQEIRHLVLTGIATSGVVLSTLREAADRDYRITVLSDLCADFDDEVHRVLTEKVFVRQAEVMTAESWLAAFSGKEGR